MVPVEVILVTGKIAGGGGVETGVAVGRLGPCALLAPKGNGESIRSGLSSFAELGFISLRL